MVIEQLKWQEQHTFLPVETVLAGVNHKLGFFPDWKKADFTKRHLEVDQEELGKALTFRYENESLYLYIKTIFEDEREVEGVLRALANRPNIKLKFPMTEEIGIYIYMIKKAHWQNHIQQNMKKLLVNKLELVKEYFYDQSVSSAGLLGQVRLLL